MPCRAEFRHNKALETLLSKYPHIEKLYISIDEDGTNWKSAVQSLKLSGFQLLASKELLESLKKVVYQSNTITVPRYFLIDSHGKILNRDLPRPSDLDVLKTELDKLIK